jgi:hypothetical protein
MKEQSMTDEEILHLWDTRVNEPTAKYPLTAADKINFARSLLASQSKQAGQTEQDHLTADAVAQTVPGETPRLYVAATGHVYAGLCPDDTQPDSRDSECPACLILAAHATKSAEPRQELSDDLCDAYGVPRGSTRRDVTDDSGVRVDAEELREWERIAMERAMDYGAALFLKPLIPGTAEENVRQREAALREHLRARPAGVQEVPRG